MSGGVESPPPTRWVGWSAARSRDDFRVGDEDSEDQDGQEGDGDATNQRVQLLGERQEDDRTDGHDDQQSPEGEADAEEVPDHEVRGRDESVCDVAVDLDIGSCGGQRNCPRHKG